jgi:hypothetical protein
MIGQYNGYQRLSTVQSVTLKRRTINNHKKNKNIHYINIYLFLYYYLYYNNILINLNCQPFYVLQQSSVATRKTVDINKVSENCWETNSTM